MHQYQQANTVIQYIIYHKQGPFTCNGVILRSHIGTFTSERALSALLKWVWCFMRHRPSGRLWVFISLNLIWFPVCVSSQSSTGLFTGSAWTCAAPGEASAPAWPSSRSSPWWLSICSSCTPWISKSPFLALRTSSIIRSPPLPGQGRHHRARVANQTSSPQTSWTLSEEASCAFFFQRRRSFQK